MENYPVVLYFINIYVMIKKSGADILQIIMIYLKFFLFNFLQSCTLFMNIILVNASSDSVP